MPLMFVTYMLQYLDKVTLGYTAVMGIQKDTVSFASVIDGLADSPLASGGPAILLD
jgi:alpha-D-ribose 1-methylphosphonate 5-triphosphate synthase subunit PhnG